MAARHWIIIIIGISLLGVSARGDDAAVDACFAFDIRVSDTEVLEFLPLVAQVKVTNICPNPRPSYYRQADPHNLERWSVLHAKRSDGDSYALTYVGGVQPSETAPIPLPVAPGETMQTTFVRSLVIRQPPPRRWAGDLRDLLQLLPPGEYVAHCEAPASPGRKLVSNEFEFVVATAKGVDAAARERLKMSCVDFFEGRDVPPDQGCYDGAPWRGKVDVSRFGEIQKILDDFPESDYATWIRFWKLYHHGSAPDALTYAREHKDFPLSDNLLLRKAQQCMNGGDHSAGTELVDEILAAYPDSDVLPQARELRKKLSHESDEERVRDRDE